MKNKFILSFDEFSLQEMKQHNGGSNDAEANIESFYKIAKLSDEQKNLVSHLVDKTASEENINKQKNYKVLILAKLAGLDKEDISILEEDADSKHDEFIQSVLVKLAKLKMDQAKAFSEL